MLRTSKYFATAATFLAYIALGLLIASLGATFLQLQLQTSSTASQLTFVFTLRSFGYLVGSAAGGLLLDKYPSSGTPTIALALFATSISTALIPFAQTVAVLCVLCCTQGVAMGTLDTIANVMIIYLWQDEAGPWMQGLHCSFAIGAVISPLVVRLSQELSTSKQDVAPAFFSFSIVTCLCGIYFCFVPTPSPPSPKPLPLPLPSTELSTLTSVSASVLESASTTTKIVLREVAVKNGSTDTGTGTDTDTDTTYTVTDVTAPAGGGTTIPTTTSSHYCTRHNRIILTTAACLGVYVGAETGFGGFVLLYSKKMYGMTEAEGQYLNALFFGFLTIGRILGIPLSKILHITKQLIIDLVLAVVGCSIITIGLVHGGDAMNYYYPNNVTNATSTTSIITTTTIGEQGQLFLWIGTAVYGLGLGTIFPCAVLQAEHSTDLSGRAASVLMVGAAVGEMLIPLGIGLWTDFWSPGFVVGIGLTTLFFVLLALLLIVQSGSNIKVRQ